MRLRAEICSNPNIKLSTACAPAERGGYSPLIDGLGLGLVSRAVRCLPTGLIESAGGSSATLPSDASPGLLPLRRTSRRTSVHDRVPRKPVSQTMNTSSRTPSKTHHPVDDPQETLDSPRPLLLIDADPPVALERVPRCLDRRVVPLTPRRRPSVLLRLSSVAMTERGRRRGRERERRRVRGHRGTGAPLPREEVASVRVSPYLLFFCRSRECWR